MRRSTIRRAIGYAIGWLWLAAMSPGVSRAQTSAMPGMPVLSGTSGMSGMPGMPEGAAARERAVGQDPVAIVSGFLASPDATTQAWGAWYAGRDVMTELIPGVIAVASQHVSPGGTLAERAARDIALDALIQLRAEVPADLIARLLDRTPAQALILAMRSEDAGETLLQFVRANPEGAEQWFAAANLLLSRRQPGFARVLVDRLALDITVHVSDEGTMGAGSSIGMGIGCGIRIPGDPRLPPWAVYGLTTQPEPDVAVLSTGPVPIYYERQLFRAGLVPSPHGTFASGPTSHHRLQYAAALMDVSEQRLPLRARESHSVKWTSQASLDATLQSFRVQTRDGFAALVNTLVAAGLVTKEDAREIEPVINETVHDLRTERSTPLTQVSAVMP